MLKKCIICIIYHFTFNLQYYIFCKIYLNLALQNLFNVLYFNYKGLIRTANLYSFDLIEDTFDFIFDDLAKIIGIVVIIAAGVYIFKKYVNKKDSNSDDR